jgi:8-oxo-dGTP pyrophosphatase MutT (NUDIX family)
MINMPRFHIRAVALCVFHHHGRILLSQNHDRVGQRMFYRPLGGGIEFGELGVQAVAREIREEISAEITDLRLLGTLENIFMYQGRPGHEMVLVYDGKFTDASLYRAEVISGTESDGQTFDAVWRRLDELSGHWPLYPNGLLPLLQSVRFAA